MKPLPLAAKTSITAPSAAPQPFSLIGQKTFGKNKISMAEIRSYIAHTMSLATLVLHSYEVFFLIFKVNLMGE